MRERSQYLIALVAGAGVALGGVAIASPGLGSQAPVTLTLASGDADLDDDAEVELFVEETDTPGDGVVDDLPEDQEPGDVPEDDEDASAFSAWVASIPGDWGCVRGQLIRSEAAGPKDGFEGPEYGSIDEAIDALGLEGRRCAEVARARVAGEDVGPPEHAARPDEAGPPEHAGRPEGSGPPDHAGRPEGAGRAESGPPEHAGPPDHAGRPEGAGRAEAGPPARRGGPPEGRGGR